VVISCTNADISKMEPSNPRGNVRLIKDDGTMDPKGSIIDDEPTKESSGAAFIEVDNFTVTNSEALELVQWHTGKTGAANEG